MKLTSTHCSCSDNSVENKQLNAKSMEDADLNSPDEWVIKNILNYSKSLQVIEVPCIKRKIDVINN